MNLHELDEFKLEDTVKFHNRLNPRLWGRDEHLLPQVRNKLLEIAADFQEFLGLPDLDVEDITISGSNAAYSYSPNSDIDLHLVVKMPADNNEVYQELFNAKKYQYNEQHNIKIGGADVELYVQPSDQEHHSQGIYSIKNNQWVSVPRRKKAQIDDACVRHKVEDISARIAEAIASGKEQRMIVLKDKIKKFRQSGLDQQGEFGCDNLAFKVLRNQGDIKNLHDAINAAKDSRLSLAERNKPKQHVRYGFGEGHQGQPYSSEDGVAPSTCMFLNEDDDQEKIVHEFIEWAAKKLGIRGMPEIFIHADPEWSVKEHSFGRYEPGTHRLHVNMANRHLLDILRTTAHELVHCRQNQQQQLPADAGRTGSRWENEAHAKAGVIMRDFADAHPELFNEPALAESASGYIPTKKQARDPRYSMALTVDIKPGQVGKEANKMGLETDSQGQPKMVYKSVNKISESRAAKSRFALMPATQEPGGIEDDLGNQEATGPEFPPQFPEGTTKIDVSDVYDWYKIGQQISDLDDMDPEDVGQGPPQTVITFPSDEAEQAYLKQFKRLGLKTHDIDAGREHYHEDLIQQLTNEFALLENEFLGEINMSTGSLRQQATKTGAIAGMEFEMIVPNVEGDNDYDGDMEPDYGYDEGVSSIQDAYDFFYDGDYNSRGDVTRLREKMTNEYQEWLSESFDSRWDSDESEFVYSYLRENASGEEIAEILGTESDANGEYPDPDKQAYLDATDKVIEEGYGNYWYDQAREVAQEDFYQSADMESEWLESRDLNNMSDIENEYGMSWPHWNSTGNGGERSIEDVANDFQDAVGRDVQASSNYHSGRVERPSPSSQHYVVEPDGSLEGEDSADVGLEFVSPPLPIDVILNDLNKVKRWAKSYGCYTNDSTGLHINISVPNYSRENLDFVKLALLLGDEYVLDSFGRAGNTYAKSAMKLVRDQVRQRPDEAQALLDKMKGNLDSLASKAIHSGTTQKYTSINTKDGHIEFRSPGGDWLDENFDKIENTLLRFTVAMSAALNPEMYREEYLKKLYKLLTQDQKGDDTIKYFSEYVAGKIPAAALRSFVKQAQLERKLKNDPTGGEKYWWSVGRPGYGAGVEVVATSKEEAIEKGKKEYPDWANATNITAKPLRPYAPESTKTVRYEIYNKQTGNAVESAPDAVTNDEDAATFLDDYISHGPHSLQRGQARDMFDIRPVGTSRPATSTGRPYEIFNPSTEQVAVAFLAPNDEAALVRLDQYQRSHPDDPFVVRDANGIEVVGLDIPMAPGRAATSPTGQWKVIDSQGRELYRFRPAHNTRAKANELAASWAREYNWDSNYQVEPAEEEATTNPAPGTFTGTWRVLANGREVYRFSGIGNRQADANGVATTWAQNNGYARQLQAGDIEVYPVVS